MLSFANPLLLIVPAAVAVVGLWAIQRARTKPTVVSSLRLWRGLATPSASSTYRRFDPLWLTLLAAAVLAAVALAGPFWQWQTAEAPLLRIHATVRSLGQERQLFVQLLSPGPVTGTLAADKTAQPFAFTPEAFTTGEVVKLPPASTYILTANRTSITFDQPTTATFSVQTVGTVDPALARLLRLHPAATLDNATPPTLPHAVILIGGDSAEVGVPPAGSVVIGIGTPRAGLTPGPTVALPDVAPEPSGLPGYIDLQHVRIRSIRTVAASAEWRPLITVAGHPVLLRRHDLGGPTFLWLAFRPSEDSTWPADPSFVLTFSALLSDAIPLSTTTPIDWPATTSSAPPQVAAAVALAPACVLVAAGLLLLFMWRCVKFS